MSDDEAVYESPTPYEAARINAAAIYCSDGRIGDQVDDFLHVALGLPRYDRLACPGGPVALAGRAAAFWDTRGVEEQLRFLLRVHQLLQVVLVAHEACAYYGERLGIAEHRVEQEQRLDLASAASAVRRLDSGIAVAAFFARRAGARISFEPVRLDAR